MAGRERLVTLSRRYGMPIVEDDPYGELAFDGPPVAPLRALDADVLYVGTFSKTIAPGIRTGWIVTPPALWDKMYALKEAMDINSDRFTQATVAEALATGFYPGHVARIRAVYRARRDLMLDALREYLPPDVVWTEPEGGFFVWVRLPRRNGRTSGRCRRAGSGPWDRAWLRLHRFPGAARGQRAPQLLLRACRGDPRRRPPFRRRRCGRARQPGRTEINAGRQIVVAQWGQAYNFRGVRQKRTDAHDSCAFLSAHPSP